MKRRTFLAGSCLMLPACSGSTRPTTTTQSQPRSISASAEPAPWVATPRVAPSGSYQHGRFRVSRDPDGGQTIEGGSFMPPSEPPVDVVRRGGEGQSLHALFVDFQSKELHYYRWAGENRRWQPHLGFAILSPAAHSLPQDVVMGKVSRIDTNPTWYPPASIRSDYARLGQSLPEVVRPGDPKNLMGAARFEIDWSLRGWSTVRLHGAVGYPAIRLDQIETYGCVSLLDSAILQLIHHMAGQRSVTAVVEEGVTVVFHRRSVRT